MADDLTNPEDGSDGIQSDDDLLASFFENEDTDLDDDNLLASFFDDEPEEDDADNDDLLASFFGNDADTDVDEKEDSDLASFLTEDNVGTTRGLEQEEEEEEDSGGILGDLVGSSNQKPKPLLPYKKEKRKARLDITKNSKSDHRDIKRYTKSELNDQLKRDYKFMLGKPYMMIQPVTIMAEYPYKKKKSDDDEIKSYNTELDYVLVIGKLLKWRSTEEFKGKPYKLGEIMYMKRGIYWVDGKELSMEPHFAIVINRSYKRIKSKRIRDLLAPLKQRLRSGKPFSIYKDFPIIIRRTGAFS
ncbi:MAG: hypothetical protein AB8E82_00980 [Aureispira sp.]